MPYQKKKQTRYNRRRLFGAALPAPLTRTRAVSYGPPANATAPRPMPAPRPRPLGRDGKPISKERQKVLLQRWADRNGPGPWTPDMISGPANAVETSMNAAEEKKTRKKTKTAVEPETHPTGTGHSKKVGIKQKPPTNVWYIALDNVVGDSTPKRDYKGRTVTTTVRSVSPIVGDKYCVSHRLLTPRSRRLRQRMKLNGISSAKIRSEMSNRTFYRGQSALFPDAALDWPTRKTVTRAGLNECAIHQPVTVSAPTWPSPNHATNGFYPTSSVLPTWAFLAGDYNAMVLQDSMRALWANGIGSTSIPEKNNLKMILPLLERTLAVEVMNRSSYTDLEVHIALFRNFTDNALTLAQRLGTSFIDPSRYLYNTGTTATIVNDNFTDSTVTYSDGLSVHRDWYPTLNNDIVRDDYQMIFHDIFVLAPHDVARVSTTVEQNGHDVLEFDRRILEITGYNKSFCLAGDYQYLIWANGRCSMVNAVYRRYLQGPPETAKILPETLERMSAPVEYTVKCELSCSVGDRTWFGDKDSAPGAYGWDGTVGYWAIDTLTTSTNNINMALRALDRRLRAIELFDAVRKDRPLLPMEHSATVLDISPDKWNDISIKDSGWVVPINVEVRTTSATYSVTDSKN